MAKNQRRSTAFSAGTYPFDLTPGHEMVHLVFNILSAEYKVVKKSGLDRVDQNRIVTLKDGEILAHDSENESFIVMPKNDLLLSENAGLIDVSQTHVLVEFDQRSGLGGPFGKHEKEDGKPRILETQVKTALRETLEETPFDLTGEEIISSVSYLERPSQKIPYFNIVFPLNARKIRYRPYGKIQDPLIEPKLSKFYRLDSIPIESPLNNEVRGSRKDDDEADECAKHMGIVERVGCYHAAIRRIVGLLLQLRQPILAELGRPGCENADDLVQLVLRRYDYKHIFSYRTLHTFQALNRMDFVVAHLLKGSDGGIKRHDLASKMAKNLVLLIDDEELQNEAMSVLRGRLRDELLGSKGFFWHDTQRKPVCGSFEEFVEYCKFRKSRVYLKRQDEEEELALSDERLTPAPESGEYRDGGGMSAEDLWLREIKNVAKI